jgi:hypothetical protein
LIGYVRPDVEELKVKELKLYRTYYCGICTALSQKYGPLSRAFLSYDATFMAIVKDSFCEKAPRFGIARCPLPPFRKKKIVVRNEAINFGIDVSQLGTKLKMDDLKRDEKRLKKALVYLFNPLFGKVNASLFEYVKHDVSEMFFYEMVESADPNEPADAFGKAVMKMMQWKDVNEKASFLLYLIGKWVYLIDALDDLEEDLKKKTYNPFILKYKNYISSMELSNFFVFVREKEKTQINFLLSRMQEEFFKIENDMKRNSELVKNVLFHGIPKVSLRVLNKKEGDKA